MEIKLNSFVLILFLIVTGLGFVLLFSKCNSNKPDPVNQALLDKIADYEFLNSDLKQKSKSLESVIENIEEENTLLLSQIAILQKQKQKIEYIDVIKYKTKEVIVYKETLPESFIYRNEQGMEICSFSYEKEYQFSVIPIEYTLNIVKTEDKSNITLSAVSDYNKEKVYELPIEVKESSSVKITDYPNLNLNLSLGVSLSYSNAFEVSPTFQVPFIHINDSIDIITPKVTLNSSPSLGLDLINYKVSDHLQYLTDTWIGIGPSVDLEGNKYLELTLTSKF